MAFNTHKKMDPQNEGLEDDVFFKRVILKLQNILFPTLLATIMMFVTSCRVELFYVTDRFFCVRSSQLIVNWWFGFLESPYERDWDSWVYP